MELCTSKVFCFNTAHVGGDRSSCVLITERKTMSEVTVSIVDNGPFIVKGEFTVKDGEGNAFPKQQQVALCRCGASQNKPFCDGSHAKSGFESAERAPQD